MIGVTKLANSSVNFSVRPWVNVIDYGAAEREINQAMVDELRRRNLEIPFPQVEVRMLGKE